MNEFSSEISENCSIYSRVFQKSRELIECSKDFILPDFYADIKRIINTSGSIFPEDCFVEGGKVNIGGTLSVKILFIDDEGKLRSATFAQDYSALIPLDDGDSDDLLLVCCPALENISVKTVNPRKVSVRGRIDAGIKTWKELPSAPELSETGFATDVSPEMKREKIICMTPFSVRKSDFELSEDISLEGEADEIIYCDAEIEISDCRVTNGGAEVKGSVNADVIYYDAMSGEPVHVARRIPFSNFIELPDTLTGDAHSAACAYIRSVDCNISGDNSGENNKIELDIGYAISVNGAAETDCSYVSDMYMPAYSLDTESERVNFSGEVNNSVKNIRVESCSESALDEGSKVMFVLVRPQIESVSDGDGVKKALGSSLINVVYKNADSSVSSRSFSGDFEIDLSDISDFDEYIFLVRATSRTAKNSESALCVGYDLEANILSWKNTAGEMIRSANVMPIEDEKERKPFTLYYPASDESLWDIGKKYNVNVSSIAEANSLEPDSDERPKVIIIPRNNAKKIKNA